VKVDQNGMLLSIMGMIKGKAVTWAFFFQMKQASKQTNKKTNAHIHTHTQINFSKPVQIPGG